MNEGTLLTDGTRPAVRLERHLADPPPIVWRALTERDQLRAWFPCDVVVAGGRWEVGAAITFLFPAEVIDMTLDGEVLSVDEPIALAFTWGEETLRFELSAHDQPSVPRKALLPATTATDPPVIDIDTQGIIGRSNHSLTSVGNEGAHFFLWRTGRPTNKDPRAKTSRQSNTCSTLRATR